MYTLFSLFLLCYMQCLRFLLHTCFKLQPIMYSVLYNMVCKMKSSLETTCLFFSSFSILLIAMDRSMMIVYPTTLQISPQMVQKYMYKLTYWLLLPGLHPLPGRHVSLPHHDLPPDVPHQVWSTDRPDYQHSQQTLHSGRIHWPSLVHNLTWNQAEFTLL